MNKGSLFLCSAVIAAALCGCAKTPEVLNTVSAEEKITSMKSYLCDADITVKSNKGENNYSVHILWDKSGKYKISTYEPEILNKNIILFDGKGLWQYNPNIESKISLKGTGDDFDGKSKIFISEFMKSYLNGNNSSKKEISENGRKYIELSAEINGGKYFAYQKLLIDAEEKTPFKLETYDKENNVVFLAEFSNFEYDAEFQKEEFSVLTD